MKDTMAKGTALLTLSGLFGQAVGFVYRIALSRLVGAELMGLYQLIMPVYAVLSSLTAAGLTVAVSTLSAKYSAQGQWTVVRQVRKTCLKLLFALFAPLAVLTALLSDPISVYLLGDARTRLGLVLLLPCILLTGIENLQKHSFFGTGRVAPPAFSEMAEQVVRSVAVIGLLIAFLPQNPERTVGLIVLGMVICEVFSAATLTILFQRCFGRRVGGQPLGGRDLTREVVRIALPVGGTSLLGNLMGSANAVLIPQRLVAGGMGASEAMSAFGVINGMELPMLLLPSALIGAMSLVLVPRLARSTALGRRKDVLGEIGKAIGAASVFILPAMALLTVIGPHLGQILYHEPRVGQHMTALAVGVALSCYQAVLASALNGVGRQKAAAWNLLLSDGVQLAFTYFLVGNPQIGLKGYVTGLWVSSLVGAALNWRSLRRAVGIHPKTFCWMVAPGLGALLMGLCCRLLFCKLLDAGVGALGSCLTTGVFGVILYVAALQAQGVKRAEILGGLSG